jgi:hypothetical protein
MRTAFIAAPALWVIAVILALNLLFGSNWFNWGGF